MQLRVDSANAKAIKALSKEHKKTKGRRKSYAAIGNELIQEGLDKMKFCHQETMQHAKIA